MARRKRLLIQQRMIWVRNQACQTEKMDFIETRRMYVIRTDDMNCIQGHNDTFKIEQTAY